MFALVNGDLVILILMYYHFAHFNMRYLIKFYCFRILSNNAINFVLALYDPLLWLMNIGFVFKSFYLSLYYRLLDLQI